MKEWIKNTIVSARRIYAITLSIWTALLGVLFIVQIASIYSPDVLNPYTAETVSAHWQKIAALFWCWVVMIVGGAVLWTVFPEDKERPRPYGTLQRTLATAKARLPQEQRCDEARAERFVKTAWIVCGLLAVAAAVVTLVFLLDKTYTPRHTQEVFTAHSGAADRLIRSLPWILATFLLVCIVTAIDQKKQEAELRAVKARLSENAKAGILPAKREKKQSHWAQLKEKMPFLRSKWWGIGLRIAIGTAGLVLVIVGICDGGMRDVWTKAIEICTQCIGLG